jgi:hypothetical protein
LPNKKFKVVEGVFDVLTPPSVLLIQNNSCENIVINKNENVAWIEKHSNSAICAINGGRIIFIGAEKIIEKCETKNTKY